MLADPELPAMATLKRWTSEGKLELIESNPPKVATAYGWPGAAPKPAQDKSGRGFQKGRPGKITESGKATFESVASVLFPRKNSQKLQMNEINDIIHLIRHHASQNEIFVTGNLISFINDGRREQLKSYFDVVAMTPEETVQRLHEVEGWSIAAGKKDKTKKV